MAAVKQYENNNKPAFLNCEALSKQAAVDEQQPKGERLCESVLTRVETGEGNVTSNLSPPSG